MRKFLSSTSGRVVKAFDLSSNEAILTGSIPVLCTNPHNSIDRVHSLKEWYLGSNPSVGIKFFTNQNILF